MEWTWPDMMDNVEVEVGLPRFKLEEKYDMKNVLVSMGMVDAFDSSLSDFSGKDTSSTLVSLTWLRPRRICIKKYCPLFLAPSRNVYRK